MTPTTAESNREEVSWLRRWWWVWLSLAWVFVGLLFAAQTVWLGGFAWDAAIAWALLDWGFWIPVAPLVVGLARRLEITAASWRWTVPVHVLLAVACAATIEISSVVAFQRGWMPDPRPAPRTAADEFAAPPGRGVRGPPPMPVGEPGLIPPPPPPGIGAEPARRTMRADRGGMRRRIPLGTGRGRMALPIYCALVVGAHALAYHRRSFERERRALVAETKLAEARALAMQTQLQPHFFFNALNTVASLVYTQPEQAEETICALGELMRGVLDASHRREISLREELAFVDRYLAVQRIRFGDRLRVVHEIPDDTLGGAVPTLLLQPLVENAVVHGVAPFPSPGTVTLRARRDDRHLVLEVGNTTGGPDHQPQAARAGEVAFTPRVGLANTRSRLEALYGADFRFTHRRTADGGVLAEVAIPWKGSPSGT